MCRYATSKYHVTAIIIVLCLVWLSARPLQAAGPVLHVRVYDYAKLAPDTLKYTEAEADRVLQWAGIQVKWNNCGMIGGCGDPNDLVIRVVGRGTSGWFARSVLGFALPSPHGGAATLFYRHAVVAQSHGSFVYLILGRAMAHEIAHLLLGPASHSPVGVMRPGHAIDEFAGAGTSQWFFTAVEASHMRDDVLRRSEERRGGTGNISDIPGR